MWQPSSVFICDNPVRFSRREIKTNWISHCGFSKVLQRLCGCERWNWMDGRRAAYEMSCLTWNVIAGYMWGPTMQELVGELVKYEFKNVAHAHSNETRFSECEDFLLPNLWYVVSQRHIYVTVKRAFHISLWNMMSELICGWIATRKNVKKLLVSGCWYVIATRTHVIQYVKAIVWNEQLLEYFKSRSWLWEEKIHWTECWQNEVMNEDQVAFERWK